MKLKKTSYSPKNRILYIVLGIVLIGLVGYQMGGGNLTSSGQVNSVHSLEKPTFVSKAHNYSTIISEGINRIYQDSIVSIHINENLGIPFISYVYKDELVEREKTDNFFLHFHLKDPSRLLQQRKLNFLNMDFRATRPLELEIKGEKYFIFKRILDDEFIEFENIKHINTGRFDPAQGSKSYEIRNVTVEGLVPTPVGSGLEKLTLEISEKSYKKIQAKRDTALSNNVLITRDDDLVNARVTFKDSKREKAKMRLKGDWTDHLNHPSKWSYRIIMEGEETLDGMRKFSVQHPKSRNYLWEWMFNKMMKENDVIGLRYDFVDVDVAVTVKDQITRTIPMGIMAKEESFDKILIENNRRREGLILAFDESLIWEDRELQFELGLDPETRAFNLSNIQNAPIKVFNENKVLGDPGLAKQFDIAKELVEGMRSGNLKVSEVFDLDRLTTFVAISNLFGANHGLIEHNLRLYFNPITSKLEPISFDSYAGRKLTGVLDYPFAEEDSEYRAALMEKLEWVSSEEFVNGFVEQHYDEIYQLFLTMNNEFTLNLDLSVLEYNSNFIKKMINPSNAVVSSLVDQSKGAITVEVNNVADYPVVVKNLRHKDGKKLSKQPLNTVLTSGERKTLTFELDDAFANAFVSKKNKVGEFRFPKDVAKLRLMYHLDGVSHIRATAISPYTTDRKGMALTGYKKLFETSVDDFEFISEENGVFTIAEGNHQLKKNLVVPKGGTFVIPPGTTLDFVNGASLISFSAVTWEGTETTPIRFVSSNGTGGGIFVNGASETSRVAHCVFSNLSNPSSPIWNLSGAVNFHESDVAISNSVFEKNRCEDGLNIIRSQFTMSDSNFNDTQSDAFDGDFVEGSLSRCRFVNSGNDGVDVSGSILTLENIEIVNPSDKAISAGEASTITGQEIKVLGGEIGVVSKDLSNVALQNVSISGTRLGFSCFQKKSEFGVGRIEVTGLTLAQNELDHLIENGSTLLIDNAPVKTVSNNVIDQMYGVEYGKSSR